MKKVFTLISIFLFLNQAALFANSPSPAPEDAKFATARAKMVDRLKKIGIGNQSVLNAMGKVQRHLFSPDKYVDRAYDSISIPLDKFSTISQPHMVALMTEMIRPKAGMKVFEVGTASGYSAAVLAEIVGEVYTVEIVSELAVSAEKKLKELGYTNVHVKSGDGFFGWPEAAPFDAIIMTCTADKVPPKLAEQLKEGGRIVMPMGEDYSHQTLVVITKTNGQLVSRPIEEVQFVPMFGEIKK